MDLPMTHECSLHSKSVGGSAVRIVHACNFHYNRNGEKYDTMKALENKTEESKRAMDILDALDEIRTNNARAASVKIDAVTSIAFGRQFDHTYALYSRVTRTSIDALKEFFREELSKEDIDLLVKQKKQYGVI